MSTAVASARLEWEEGNRRFEEAVRDPAARDRLYAQVEVVSEELRKRLGSVFTLEELAHAYLSAERWARQAVAERAPTPGWPRTAALAEDAAFHAYARGAIDYKP
ncbi:MAG: hypothetical protein QOK13_605 [Gaiellaceae bacterium]|jgi:hypothetical protein|nr:hypothetical protein [Gaiellaceae bacterium]